MTTFVFDTLANGATINSFNPSVDLLQFNTASAAGVVVSAIDADTTTFTFGGNTVTVNGLGSRQIAAGDPVHNNVLFSDGSVLFVGDGLVDQFGDQNGNILGGTAGNDQLLGLEGDDELRPGAGNDLVNGSTHGVDGDVVSYFDATGGVTVNLSLAGPQNIGGGMGTDTLISIEGVSGGDFDDFFIGNSANGIFDGGLGVDTISYANATGPVTINSLESGSATGAGVGTDTLARIENVIGSSFNDSLAGSDVNNVIEGGPGNDLIDGGVGTDTASYASAPSAVTVSLASLGVQQNTVGAGLDTLVGIESLLGSAFNDTLTGNAQNNVLEGGAGNDVLNGAAGNDTASYASAGGQVTVRLALTTPQNTLGAGTDTLLNIENVTGSAFGDDLQGNAGNNVLVGGAGGDLLRGDAGNDTLDGGAGADTLIYSAATAGVTVNLGIVGPQNTVGAGQDTLSGFEFLNGSAFNDTLTGDAGDNFVFGDSGDDVLDGGAGNDTLNGGAGNDILDGGTGSNDWAYYNSASAGVNVNLTTGLATGGAGSDTLTGIENLLGSNSNDVLVGNALANTLSGGAGNDVLRGEAGNDILDGGTGSNDWAYYNSAGAGVNVNLTTGLATGGAGSDTLTGIENLLGSNSNDVLVGNALANTLSGGAGNDVLRGEAGNDILDGGTGSNDWAYYNSAGAGVTVNLATGLATGGAGSDTLTGIENLLGSNSNDVLVGNALANTLNGGAGNDVLRGEAGNDILDGGTGSNDWAYYNSAGAGVNVNLATGLATGGAGSDTLTGIENLLGSNSNDVLVGNALANTLNGGAGNDVLRGEAGNDILDGGTGSNDWAYYNSASAGVNVNLATGLATGGAGSDTLTGIENLLGSNSNDVLVGNALANTLSGGAGADTLNGGLGNDTYIVDNAGDITTETSTLATEIDTVQSSVTRTLGANLENLTLTGAAAINGTGNTLNNTLTGNGVANSLDGGVGNDTLNGGAGADTLIGGAGADLFVFNSKVGSDSVTDFVSGTDKFAFSQAGIHIGNGDTEINGVAFGAGPGGFLPSMELVVMTNDIAGAINTTNAAAAIGSAAGAYAVGNTSLFVVDNGTASDLFLFTSSGTDAVVSAAELTLVGVATSTAAIVPADFTFVA